MGGSIPNEKKKRETHIHVLLNFILVWIFSIEGYLNELSKFVEMRNNDAMRTESSIIKAI